MSLAGWLVTVQGNPMRHVSLCLSACKWVSCIIDFTALYFILLDARSVLTGKVYIKRRKVMLYFVKKKTIHQYPVPKLCAALYEQEQLRDTIPHGVIECPYCMRVWPGRKE